MPTRAIKRNKQHVFVSVATMATRKSTHAREPTNRSSCDRIKNNTSSICPVRMRLISLKTFLWMVRPFFSCYRYLPLLLSSPTWKEKAKVTLVLVSSLLERQQNGKQFRVWCYLLSLLSCIALVSPQPPAVALNYHINHIPRARRSSRSHLLCVTRSERAGYFEVCSLEGAIYNWMKHGCDQKALKIDPKKHDQLLCGYFIFMAHAPSLFLDILFPAKRNFS